MPLEIERKWVMSGNPHFTPDVTLSIFQFYTADARYRSATNVETNEVKYYKTVKKYISPGTNEEDEVEITLKEFVVQLPNTMKAINKIRRVYKFKNYKCEFDTVPNRKVVLMEVEVESMDQELDFVIWIKDLIVEEVTGKKKYNNSKMAVAI